MSAASSAFNWRSRMWGHISHHGRSSTIRPPAGGAASAASPAQADARGAGGAADARDVLGARASPFGAPFAAHRERLFENLTADSPTCECLTHDTATRCSVVKNFFQV